MNTHGRLQDRRRHQEFTDLLNDTLTTARKTHGISREQIAALLNRGVDDPCMVSKALLDKICEGGERAKFPLHKLPLLLDITGDPALLEWLARECGHLAVPMPLASGQQSAEGLLDMVERQADAVKAYRAAVCREGEGGTRITPAEAGKVSVSLDLLMASAAALKAQLHHDAHNPNPAPTTLRAFEAAKAAQGGAR